MRSLIALITVFLVAAAPAAAQEKPAQCAGIAATDPAGDQVYHVPQVQEPTPQEAPPAADITGAYFTASGGVVRANLMVADLDQSYPPPATGVRYTIYYRAGGKGYYVRLILGAEGSEPAWTNGTYEDSTLADGKPGTGEIFPGKDGVISFIVPASRGGTPGLAWSDVWSASSTLVPQSSSSSDYLPDGSASADGPRFKYSGKTCDGAGGPQPTPNPQATPAPSPGGGSGGGASGGGTGGSAAGVQPGDAVKLTISAKPTKLKAKKIRRKAVFTLTSNEALTSVTARFKKGRKAFGSGKLAKLDKKGRLTVKIRGKARKGKYTLVLSGRRANGATGTASIKITVR
jgi:hypothetical protein